MEDTPKGQLAGKMGTVIDLVTRLPVEIWFQENPRASDTKFESDVRASGYSQDLTFTRSEDFIISDFGCN